MGTITKPCPECSEIHSVKVDMDQYAKWIRGELIQNCFPEMSADEREILKTGICPKCWERMFS